MEQYGWASGFDRNVLSEYSVTVENIAFLLMVPLFSFQFDPAMQRFHAMRVSHTEHFRPTGKTFRMGFFLVIAPIICFALAIERERGGREAKYRNGEVSYRDRLFKFI